MDTCAKCGLAADQDPSDPTVGRDLARVGSVAEAGYLVALLQESGVAANARPVESFNAALGSWSLAYVVSVPVDDSQAAARLLQAEASEEFTEISARFFDAPAATAASPPVNPWRMLTVLAIVAAAGAMMAVDTFGGWRGRREAARQADRRGGPAEPINRLPDALRAHGASFHSNPAAGGPRRMLRFLPQAAAWELLTDADQDGHYESRRRFADPQVAPHAAAR